MEPSDLKLLLAYQRDGDQSAFRQLFQRHRPWIFNAARRRLGDDHLADDATQAVFLLLAGNASKPVATKQGSLAAWLFHTMHFVSARVRRDRQRNSRREKLAQSKRLANFNGDSFLDEALLILIEDSIARLPPLDREIVVRRFYQQQRFSEIGSALNLSAEAVRKRLARTLAVTRNQMLIDGAEAIPETILGQLKTVMSACPPLRKKATPKSPDGYRIGFFTQYR